MPSFDDFIVFVDESGDHGLASIDPQYPIFVLAFCLFNKNEYAETVAPAIIKFKFRYFGHDQIILHENEIRKKKGVFSKLRNRDFAAGFMDGLSNLIDQSPILVFSSVIKKRTLRHRYRDPINPYDIAMGFGLERIFLHLHSLGCRTGWTHFVFESRGAKEDKELELEFRRRCARNATGKQLPFEIILASKKCNSSGLQLADLVARPIGIKILRPAQENRAFDIILRKFKKSAAGVLKGYGMKLFP